MAGSRSEVSTTTGMRLTSRRVRFHCRSSNPFMPGSFRSSRMSAVEETWCDLHIARRPPGKRFATWTSRAWSQNTTSVPIGGENALSTWYKIPNRNYSQMVGRNEFFGARRAEIKGALTFLPLRTLSAQEVTSSVVMKLRMRERGIPAFSAAAAEYSMNPSCVGPCESVPNDIRHPASFASRSRLTFRSWRSG